VSVLISDELIDTVVKKHIQVHYACIGSTDSQRNDFDGSEFPFDKVSVA
jgi:hypothetical protein